MLQRVFSLEATLRPRESAASDRYYCCNRAHSAELQRKSQKALWLQPRDEWLGVPLPDRGQNTGKGSSRGANR